MIYYERNDEFLESFEKGLYFTNKRGEIEDLNALRVINISIDTVKQFYKGTIDRLLMNSLSILTNDGAQVLTQDDLNNNDTLSVRYLKIPFDAKISRMGKNSGYRYKIQNNEIGVVILLASYFKQSNETFSHLKIELSPHFIQQRTPREIQDYMDDIGILYLTASEPAGVSPHLCADLQGWNIPLDMADNIKTRSKAVRTYRGIDEIKFNSMDSVISSYGRAETIMIGKANSLQLSVYRKDLEIVKTDKVDYWHENWESFSLGSFNKEIPVVRFEYRFHHSIIKEFERGIDKPLNNFFELEGYLNDLWLYALKTIRYEKNSYVAPIWQFLIEDIEFNNEDIRQNFKRKQKSKSDTTSITRNIGLFIGNYLTIKCRSGLPFSEVQKELKAMSVMTEIRNNLLEKSQDEGMFFESIKQKYLERQIASKFSICCT